jgi:hypothetical protein
LTETSNHSHRTRFSFNLSKEAIADDTETEYSSSKDEDRPNKFNRTSRAWRRYTQNELVLAKSIENSRAGDLSIHLFNAFHLKKKLRSVSSSNNLKSWYSKKRWVDPQKKVTWAPQHIWTAWPLHWESVPEMQETFGTKCPNEYQEHTENLVGRSNVENDLEDLLLGIILKQANTIWCSRQFSSEAGSPDNYSLMAPGAKTTSDDASSSEDTTSLPLSDAQLSDPTVTMGSPRVRKGHLDPKVINKDPLTSTSFHSTSFPSSEDDRLENPKEEIYARPAIMADDETARKLLQPAINSVMERLNTLLYSLHRSMEDYSDDDDTEHSNNVVSNRNNQLRASNMNRMGQSDGKEYEDPEVSLLRVRHARTPKHRSRSSTRSRSRSRRSTGDESEASGRQRRGLRDWSDVLGYALLSGWRESVTTKAARRCSALFDEDMTFRRLDEGDSIAKIPGAFHISNSNAGSSEDPLGKMGAKASPQDGGRPRWEKGMLRCPHGDCWGHRKTFPIPYRVVEHIRRVHGYDPRKMKTGEERAIEGGVHIDGFMKPIQPRQGWSKGKDYAVKRKGKRKANMSSCNESDT